jgi:stage IV sporulation protein FB
MLQFFKKIPISIHPLFWVLAGIIGWLNSGNLKGTLLWVIVIFVSVLFHEMGHALTALIFGQKARITLVAFGGVTSYESKDLKFWKQFLIVLNGPLFGILLFLISTLALSLNFFENPYLVGFFKLAQLVNLFWSIINLLPVLPLDGGQLLRIALEGAFGVKGLKLSLFIGMLASLAFCIFFFVKGGFLIGALFFLFSFQSFEMWRNSKFLTQADRSAEQSTLLLQGEETLRQGKKAEAKDIFESLRKATLKGLLYNTATQYLALIKLSEGEKKEAYQLLLEIKEQLPDDAKCILHSLAFDEENYLLVAEYSALCYQQNPNLETALKNAKAFAILNEPKPSGGWIQTASQYESFNLKETLEEKVFEKVLEDDHFKHFIREIEKS